MYANSRDPPNSLLARVGIWDNCLLFWWLVCCRLRCLIRWLETKLDRLSIIPPSRQKHLNSMHLSRENYHHGSEITIKMWINYYGLECWNHVKEGYLTSAHKDIWKNIINQSTFSIIWENRINQKAKMLYFLFEKIEKINQLSRFLGKIEKINDLQNNTPNTIIVYKNC